jgi:thiol-disulfide isomerase/thioredoxin
MKNTNYTVMYRLPILTVLLFTLSAQAIAQTGKGINFIKPRNWQEVLSIAKAQNKSILVDIYTTWCGPCKMMDQNIYPDSALGVLVNKEFIAIKVQMDSTRNDDSYTKSWYREAEQIKQSAKIEAFPTLLFYNPDGQLVFKSIGYKSVKTLSKVAAYTGNTDVAGNFKKDLLAYQNGHIDYVNLPDLIVSVREIVGDQQLALDMAKDYKKNYLDHLADADYLTPQHIKFIADNGDIQLISTNDRLFDLCYNHPDIFDSIVNKGSSKIYVNATITKDEVLAKLYKDDQIITPNPDWKQISSAVKKYKKIDANSFMLKSKIDFYYKIKDWETYSVLRSQQIKKYPPIVGKQDYFDNLNSQAWYVFLGCKDHKPLERALKWSELSIDLEMPDPNPTYYDTRANILYKLGRTDEAIKYQRIAVEKNEELTKKTGRNWGADLVENLNKMLKGQPTWDTQ